MAEPPEEDIARIRAFCEDRTPADAREQFRVEAELDGGTVTIWDCQAPWEPSMTEWSRVAAAQLRYAAGRWTLYCADSDSRWHRYHDLHSGPLDDLLVEIADDPTGIFWG